MHTTDTTRFTTNSTADFECLVRLDPPEPEVNESSPPARLIQWSIEKFPDRKMVMTTAFGMEGCALIDMYARFTSSLTVAYIDTGFFFPETKQLIEQIQEKYPQLEFVRWESPVSVEKQNRSYGDRLWENNPNLCCHVRKVLPMKRNIRPYQFWISGLRKTQSQHRRDTQILSWDWKYQILKFCPLARWTREDVWKYVQANQVPFNQLHLRGYPSIGCSHCTRPVPGSSPETDSRQGRWQGSDKTECGLHYSI